MEETLSERLSGLAEMFPDGIRKVVSGLTSGTCTAVSFVWRYSRSTIWILTSSACIMVMPYAFEKERADYEDKMRQEERNVTSV